MSASWLRGSLRVRFRRPAVLHESITRFEADKNETGLESYRIVAGPCLPQPSPNNPIACHIVAGSPKTTEGDRQQLALAVFGPNILPFANLVTVRRSVIGRMPPEVTESEEDQERIWEVRLKGYTDPRMEAVYEHTVTAELTHAADRARVHIHRDASVYLITNEPCPKLWFAEMCYAADLLDLSGAHRGDFEKAYAAYEAKARELLDEGKRISNADVCRVLGHKNCQGWRYWKEFIKRYGDALEGERKVKWKHGRADTAAGDGS
jgi:hypothetical protein